MAASDPCSRWAGVPEHAIPNLPKRSVVRAAHGVDAAGFEAARARMLSYDLYPRRIVASRVCAPDGRVRTGCTIAQWLRAGPLRIPCAVRVEEVWEGQAGQVHTVRLAYRTLEGHPERGRIVFTLAWDAQTGALGARVAHVSAPALWWSRLGRPFAQRLQARLNDGAARRLAGA